MLGVVGLVVGLGFSVVAASGERPIGAAQAGTLPRAASVRGAGSRGTLPAAEPLLHVVGGRRALEGRQVGPAHAYGPYQIRTAYDMFPLYSAGLTGSGERIGIVEMYGSPTIRRDLRTFDARHDLPAPPALVVQAPGGTVPSFSSTNRTRVAWAAETSVDVEWSHALAPGARIYVAAATMDAGGSEWLSLQRAEDYLVAHDHVDVMSLSFGATEQTFPTHLAIRSFRGGLFEAQAAHVSVLAAAGDAGASGLRFNGKGYYGRRVTSWPATDPLVTAVGGTSVSLDQWGHELRPPRVWHDDSTRPLATGGGTSSVFTEPEWQEKVASIAAGHRGIPDLSLTASCTHPVQISVSFDGRNAAASVCGTSVATPILAGIVADADQLAGHRLGDLDRAIYRLGEQHAPGLIDVTSGSNTVTLPEPGAPVVEGYEAAAGYDLASGWGTVDGALFASELAGKPIPR